MKWLAILGTTFLMSCTHIELVKWEGSTFEVCCSGKCEQTVWDQKNSEVCSGEVELVGGENRTEIIGINTHRVHSFSHSTLNSKESQCRRYNCKGKINPASP